MQPLKVDSDRELAFVEIIAYEKVLIWNSRVLIYFLHWYHLKCMGALSKANTNSVQWMNNFFEYLTSSTHNIFFVLHS